MCVGKKDIYHVKCCYTRPQVVALENTTQKSGQLYSFSNRCVQ